VTPAARVSAAIGVLDAWAGGQPVEQALTNWARGARYAGSGDRAAVRDHVYDVLRCHGSCAALGGGRTGRALMIGLMRLQGVDPAAVFTGEGHAPAPLSGAEASHDLPPPGPEVDLPDWMRPALAERAGDRLDALLEAMRRRAPVWLRVNTRRATPEAAIARLAEDGIAARADDRGARALEVTSGARRVKSSSAYLEGWVEVQDLSAQRAVEAVDWPAAGRILDYCAGGGGKALAIAALGEATVLAHDANPARMRDLPARAARAGVTIRQLAHGDLPGAAPFDAVLCDVPCSGSGTWRRDPEAKWRLTPERLAELEVLQAEILADASALVAPGGRLVYMTCSLFTSENEAQVDRFLASHPGWSCLQARADTPLAASDGFFHAVFALR
jgi:16S rRNA (cytosine967-C5)-methyltransferase